jgi:diaminohydroxyphosphoribosylaminopyrimidine deaminase / 5-amino-6-(5-phosphoribosylamino)uracil reductase
MSNCDEKFMQKTLKLAERGSGSAEPNPMVGCLIVKNNRIIGKGWHKKFGGPHAEINALEDCKKKGTNPAGATMYVTLEPCCHYGKTGPCTDAIIAAKVAKVIAAMVDPSKHASGNGFKKLLGAGIEVNTDVCEEQARLLNSAFVKFASTGKCWVTLKWAQSLDGKMDWATDTGGQRWISNEKSRKDVHKLRQRVQGILVGIGTVLADDPLLTARPSKEKKLTRIVLDAHLRIPQNSRLITTAKKNPVLIVTSKDAINKNSQLADRITKKGAEILAVPVKRGRCDLNILLNKLSKRGIGHLLVEGGPTVITSFLKENLADEIIIYTSCEKLAKTGRVKTSQVMEKFYNNVKRKPADKKLFGKDIRLTGF